jgi:ubiquitin C-terminal hydrolase
MLRIAGGLICLDIMASTARQSKEPTDYTLYGLLYHHGVSASEGHYTVDVLHLNGNSNGSRETWLHIDDEIVSAVQHDVFGIFNDQRAENRGLYCRTS